MVPMSLKLRIGLCAGHSHKHRLSLLRIWPTYVERKHFDKSGTLIIVKELFQSRLVQSAEALTILNMFFSKLHFSNRWYSKTITLIRLIF